MKYIAIFLVSLFLAGNAYAISSATIWKNGKIILQDTGGERLPTALIEYKDTLYHCWFSVQALTCYLPKDTEVLMIDTN